MNLKPIFSSIVFALILFGSLAGTHVATAAAHQSDDVSFENDIKPILETNCVRCHGPEEEEVFRIDVRESFFDYISVGEPDESEIYTSLISDDEDEMMPPPDDGGPLGQSDIDLMKRWIEEGAKWPEGITLTAVQTDNAATGATSDEDSDDDAAAVDPNAPDLYRAIGSLHPAVLHLPMGLLLAAGLFALLALRGNFVMSDCAYYCLWLGTIGAIAACVTGWWFGPMEGFQQVESINDVITQRVPAEDGTGKTDRLYMHRISGLIATIFAFVLALFAASARAKDPDDGMMWKLGAIVLACGIGFVGHEGGELTWGKNHYKDLDGFTAPYIEQVTDAISGDAKNGETDEKKLDSEAEDGLIDLNAPSIDGEIKPDTEIDSESI